MTNSKITQRRQQKAPDLARIAALAREIAVTASCAAEVSLRTWESSEEYALICSIQRAGAAADMISNELGEGEMVGDASAWMLGSAA